MKRKINIVIGLVLIIVALFFVRQFIVERKQRDTITIEDITMEEYERYDKYGLIYAGKESELFDFLKENLYIDEFELTVETENLSLYNGTSAKNINIIKPLLNECKQITEILYTKESTESDIMNFTIDYVNNSNKRIILEYTYTGHIRKTFREKRTIVAITSELKKEIYHD